MKRIVLLFVLISGHAFSQGVNDYQYVVVPAKFSSFKENDKFRLNTSVKLLLQKYGFKTFFSTDSMPTQIANSNCNKLYADLIKDNGILSTKIKIVLKDCKEKVLYETGYGMSDKKELVVAYNEALREAAKSFDKLNYKYNGKNGIIPEAIPIHSQEEPANNSQTNVIQQLKGRVDSLDITNATPETFYFAQPIANGYQVVDTEPKVIMKLFNTSQKNVFIAIKGNINGTVILKNEQWFFEYYDNGKLVSEPLNLKF